MSSNQTMGKVTEIQNIPPNITLITKNDYYKTLDGYMCKKCNKSYKLKDTILSHIKSCLKS